MPETRRVEAEDYAQMERVLVEIRAHMLELVRDKESPAVITWKVVSPETEEGNADG